ncbi:MAG: SDR family NAD(P)-dependent oxidoreductase [Myxococcota bacterium]
MGRRRFTLAEGHRVLVTGGASGLGRAFARAAAQRGARLVLADIQSTEEACTELTASGAEVYGVHCDVSDPSSVDSMMRRAVEHLGGLDLVFNNAGVAAAGALEKAPLEDWEWLRRIDLDGVLYVAKASVPHLRASKGWMVNTASLAAIAQAPHMIYYNVCKAGVVALSETLYAELAEDGVGVSALCPGFFKTNLTSTFRVTHPGQRKFVEKVMAKSPLSAESVVELTLKSISRGKLYIIPAGDARRTWYLTRLAPQFARDMVARAFHKAMARAGA